MLPSSSNSPAPTMEEIENVRIKKISPLCSPAVLMEDLPASDFVRKNVKQSRREVEDIISGKNDRLLAIVGPCSVHDLVSCLEFAKRLHALSLRIQSEIKIVMRVYFEKPRTTVGWKGLVNDPDLDGSNRISKGLKLARTFLLQVNELGLACGLEFLDTISPQYFSDLVSWGAIGARTTESQLHRQLASGLSCAIGFKNATSGDVQVAVDAILSSRESHSFLSVTTDGVVAIVHTTGNEHGHVILRGGSNCTNFDSTSVKKCVEQMEAKKLSSCSVIVDCSHANAVDATTGKKDFRAQIQVCDDVCTQIANGENNLKGIMIESHLNAGSQTLVPGVTDLSKLKYGVSVTDACVNWEETEQALLRLSQAVKDRRSRASSKKARVEA